MESSNPNPNFLKIARNRFSWPGGYEAFFITYDGGTLCCKCVVDNWDDTISQADRGDGWFITAFDTTDGCDEDVACDHCYTVIHKNSISQPKQ